MTPLPQPTGQIDHPDCQQSVNADNADHNQHVISPAPVIVIEMFTGIFRIRNLTQETDERHLDTASFSLERSSSLGGLTPALEVVWQ